MLGWFFNLAYLVIMTLLFPLLLYRSWKKGKYRAGWAEKFLGKVPVSPQKKNVIWLHAVSVGEVLLIKPLVKKWIESRPEDHLVITVTTSTGYKVASEAFPNQTVSYAPLDFTWAVSRAISSIRPTMICLVELEIWPNLIMSAHRRKIPIGIINARLSENSFRGYSRIKWLIHRLMRRLGFVLSQDEIISERFRKLGTTDEILKVTGSMKFDGVSMDQQQQKVQEMRELFLLRPDDTVLLAGSTHEPEEQALLDIYRRLKVHDSKPKFMIAPRHRERFDEVAKLIEKNGFKVLRKSKINPEQKQRFSIDQDVVILLDTLGELSTAWGLATIAYVGGSLGNKRGGQNMLEPCAYGAAVVTGPNTWNFAEIMKQLLAHQGIIQVSSEIELEQKIAYLLDHQAEAKSQGVNARELIRQHQGATDHTYKHLVELLEKY